MRQVSDFFGGEPLPKEVQKITSSEWEKLFAEWVLEKENAKRESRPLRWDAPLNPEQRTAVAAVLPALVEMAIGRDTGEEHVVYAKRAVERHGPQAVLLHGPAGTGKSVVLHTLSRIMREHGLGAMLATAFTGVAAAPLPGKSPGLGAPTLCTLLGMEGSVEEGTAKMNNKQKGLDPKRIKAFEHWAGPRSELSAVFVDEVSFVSPSFMHHIDLQLQALMGCKEPFGGLVLVVGGDFCERQSQLPEHTYNFLLRRAT